MKSLIIALLAATTLASCSNAGVPTVKTDIELIKEFEGFRAKVYKCQAGKDTIGYGFTSAEMVKKGSITEAEASAELARICTSIRKKLRAELGTTLKPCEEAAVVSFIYNVGWANFKSSTMCKLLKEGKRGQVVASEFSKWVYVTSNGKKVVSKGLKNRRAKEAATFLAAKA